MIDCLLITYFSHWDLLTPKWGETHSGELSLSAKQTSKLTNKINQTKKHKNYWIHSDGFSLPARDNDEDSIVTIRCRYVYYTRCLSLRPWYIRMKFSSPNISVQNEIRTKKKKRKKERKKTRRERALGACYLYKLKQELSWILFIAYNSSVLGWNGMVQVME